MTTKNKAQLTSANTNNTNTGLNEIEDELFSEKNEIRNNWIKFGKIGDWFKGTLINVREIENQMPGKEGQKVKIYEFVAHNGEFHNILENKQPAPESTRLNSGEIWTVGGKPSIDNQMRRIKINQIFGMRFTEEKPPKHKGLNPQKIIKVYAGPIDPNFAEPEKEDSIDELFKE